MILTGETPHSGECLEVAGDRTGALRIILRRIEVRPFTGTISGVTPTGSVAEFLEVTAQKS